MSQDVRHGWTMNIDLRGGSFEDLQYIAKEILNKVIKAKSFKQLPVSGGGGSGHDPNDGFSYSVTYSCPVEERIRQLRKEADELEAQLAGDAS